MSERQLPGGDEALFCFAWDERAPTNADASAAIGGASSVASGKVRAAAVFGSGRLKICP